MKMRGEDWGGTREWGRGEKRIEEKGTEGEGKDGELREEKFN